MNFYTLKNVVSSGVLSTCLLTSAVAHTSLVSKGDQAWKNRDTGFRETGHPDGVASRIAVRTYTAALSQNPNDLDTQFKLMEALYFMADFVVTEKAEKKKLVARGLEVSRKALSLVEKKAGLNSDLLMLSPETTAERLLSVPEAPQAHFWNAIYWGFWGMTFGNFAAARADVAGKVKYHAQVLILLDETYADAGGYRILGKLHTEAPKIPFFTGWIDREYGIQSLRKANRISDLDLRNPLFLAEAIIKFQPEKKREAIRLLTELVRREPVPEYVVEQTRMIHEARNLLKKIQ